jgi:holo-[acyl-carrier protein] synthase
MPPRPFPFSFRVGTDICNVARLRAIITRRNDNEPLYPLRQFVNRVLTDPERQYFWKRFAPEEEVLTKADAVSQFLAGRYVYTVLSQPGAY